jgi:tRNA modification GTPase
MHIDPEDTIVALSSAPGPGRRAIIRLSGPNSFPIARTLFTTPEEIASSQRRRYAGAIRLAGISATLPANLYLWPEPHSYTGQDLAELHTIGSPPLVELLIAQLLDAGARAARPGEFTLRAFLSGKLDLPRAEAVLGIIEAGTQGELREAFAQLAGSVTRPLNRLRDELLETLAEVEATLDFADEASGAGNRDDLLRRLTNGMAQVTLVQKQLQEKSVDGRAFRVVLTGKPNAGKSSLFNALAQAPAALVSPEKGTTRDYLVQRIAIEELVIELVDTAGRQDATDTITEQSQRLGRERAERADLLLLCIEAGSIPDEQDRATLARSTTLGIATKSDLGGAPSNLDATSALTGAGLDRLRALLADRARSRRGAGLAPSLSRCRHHVDACLTHLRHAHGAVLFEEPTEVLALELRGALDELGEMVGAVYTDDLLDRIFSRFCIGK